MQITNTTTATKIVIIVAILIGSTPFITKYTPYDTADIIIVAIIGFIANPTKENLKFTVFINTV